MSIPGRKDDKKGSAGAAKPSPALLQAKKKWLSASKMALKIAAIKTKEGKLRWVGFAFHLDKKDKKASLFAADHKKRGKVLWAK